MLEGLLLIAVGIWSAAAVRSMKKKKGPCTGCCAGCSGCTGCRK